MIDKTNYLIRIDQAEISELQGAARRIDIDKDGPQYDMAIKDPEPSFGQRKLLINALIKKGYSTISTFKGVSVPSRERL